ncbi:PQQ-binding-like beta-propeller repeat protein [Niastella yeongjuensis]|uniref:outer membrane protein assembly factor BamB family protein n=1 Tax=Niastella yeongjuensis TaxID=354355 RepID=UPI0008BAAD0A|nr:PQQ-binding-like beta-propeller repeat protein [Niastella yeongjuensis]SEP04163.1 PQQ-like domain-containing protein [Niastella yeongjuensis]
MKPIRATLCLLLLSALSYAQVQPEFEFQLGTTVTKIKWMQQTNTGSLVAATDLSLAGIDPKTKQITWEIKELGSASEDKFENIIGTPYFMIETAKSLGLGKPQTSIIEAETGKIIFNSNDADMKISGKRPLYHLGALLIEGTRNKRSFIALLDFNTGKERWSKDVGAAKTGLSALLNTRSIFTVPPMVDKNKNLVIVDKNNVICLNGNDGSDVWRKEFKEKVEDAMLTYDRSKLFVTYENRVDLLGTDNGTSAYGEKLLKLNGKCNGLAPYDKKSYIIKHSEGVNIIDAETGELRWKKESSLDNINDIRLTGYGILAINNEEKATKFYLINNEGKKVWKFELSSPAVIIEPTEKGILYFTESRANLVEYEKGKELWKRDIKIRKRPAFGFDDERNRLLVYSDDKLNAFSLADGNMTVLTEALPLKDYDEDKELATIEVRKSGYFINSLQNTSLVDFDGKVIFNHNYKEAGLSKGVRALMKGAAVAATIYSGAKTLQSVRMRPATDKDGNLVNEIYVDENTSTYRSAQVGGDVANGLFAMANKRWTATKATKDALFILTKFESGVNGLVKIDKDSGKDLVNIPFGDKDPAYIVDEAENKLYVVIKDKFIQGYDLNANK